MCHGVRVETYQPRPERQKVVTWLDVHFGLIFLTSTVRGGSIDANAAWQIWPALTGGCRLDGRMDLHLRAMDGWARTEVRPLAEQRDFASVPFVSGRAVKA